MGGEFEMKDLILVEIGKIKGNLKVLWDLAKAERLDRKECLDTFHEIDRSFYTLMGLYHNSLTKRWAEVEPRERLLIADSLAKTFTGRSIVETISQGLSTIESTLYPPELSNLFYSLENPQTYGDKSVKSSIMVFCKNLGNKIINFENAFGVKSELLRLAEFTSLFPSFTQNWSVATVYLTAMEISVKKNLKERGKEITNKFKENFQQLLFCLKEDNVKISELEKALPSVFWDIRNKVIHEGYSPTDEELKLIREYIVKLLEKLDLQ